MKKNFTLLFSALLLFTMSAKAQLVGGTTYPINGTQNPPTSFSTVANAFTYLNASGTSGTGTITLEIASGYTGETGTIPALTAYTGMNAIRPIVLKPASGQSPTISTAGAANTGVIKFNGTRFFTIDGSNNGTNSRNLTITTTSTTTSVRLVDLVPTATSSCKLITVKNVNLRGNSTTTAVNTYAAIYLGSGTASPGAALATGNDSNLFQNNLIEAVRNGIFLRGTNTAGQYDNYNRVLDNTIGGTVGVGGTANTTYYGGVNDVSGVYLNSQQNAIIEGNLIRNTVPGNYYARGINLDALAAGGSANKDILINANRITGLVYTGTGGYGNHGMRIQTNNNTANNIRITNNFISNIGADGDNITSVFDYGVYGIELLSNAAAANNNVGVFIYHNSINLFDNGVTKLLTRTNLVAACIAMQTNVAGGVRIYNNILQNTYPGSGATNAKTVAIYVQNTTANPMLPANNGRSNYNSIYVNGANTANMIGFMINANQTTFTNWKALSVDSTSKNADAQFQDNINLYTIKSDLNNAGIPLGIATDVDKKARSLTAPDIGASEMPAFNLGVRKIPGLVSGCSITTKTITANIRNFGTDTIKTGDTIRFWYTVNGSAKTWDSIILTSPIPSGDSLVFSFPTPYNFSTVGNYTVYAGINFTKDEIKDNDSLSVSFGNFNCLSTNPFIADFETGDEGFTQTGNWVRGTPAKTNMSAAASGKNAWVTNSLTGPYTVGQMAYLYSPLFDFSKACQPKMTWKMIYVTEANWDALVVEASTDNTNWVKVNAVTPAYNSTSANGPVAPNKWAGVGTPWQTYTADLSAFANSPMLRLRFFFGSDNISAVDEGFAIDSVAIEMYPPLGNLSVLSSLKNDTAFVKAPYKFTSSVAGKTGVKYYWYVDNVLVDSVNGSYSTTWLTTGTHQIKHIAKSCAEADTVIIPITVATPVGLPVIDFIANRYVAEAGESVKITSLTDNGVFAWSWIISPDMGYDYLAQTVSPTYSFIAPTSATTADADLFFYLGGKYDVCLIAENVNGSDTICKPVYLTVHNAFNACTYSSVPFPTGKIYDGGMSGGNYANNDNCKTTIEPDCADTIYLMLNKLSTEANGDYLRIYDGDETTGKPLWDRNQYPQGLSGNLASIVNLPSPMIATSGFVTVRFVANGANVGQGYELEYWTVNASQKPDASFDMPDSLCPATNIVIKNTTATRGNTLYFWDIDGDDVDDFVSKDLTFQYGFTGTYNVRLVAQNCIGSDTVYKTIVIQNPTTKPAGNFTVDMNAPGVGDMVRLSDLTPGCVQGLSWTITPTTFSYANGTSSSSKNPVVIFNATGCYNVRLITWNGVGYDTLLRTCYINVKNVCQPFVSQLNTDIGISRVQLNTINNQSPAGTQGYTNYTNLYSTVLVKGGKYELTLERTSALNNMTRKAWIDYNQDGTFDASETVAVENQAQTLQFKTDIIVPRSVASGYTRLRVGAVFSTTTVNPCGSNFIGEFEDYRIILIGDTVKPVITLTGTNPMNIERGRGYAEPGATAMDNVDGDITAKIIITGAVDTLKTGTYTISYNVTDSAGNIAATVTRTVNITPDVTKPVITVNGKLHDTMVVFTSYTDPMATATDIVDGTLTSFITILSNNLDTSKLGTYTITYTVTDSSGNTATIDRLVTVIDTTKPVIVLTGNNPLIWGVNVPYTDPGHTVTDNYNTGLLATLSGVVNEKVTGTYKVTFTVMDSSGNVADTVVRDVIVSDTIKPVVTLVGPSIVTIDVFTSYFEFGSSATDNYDNSLPPVTMIGTVDTAVVADYELKYIVTDSENNTSDTVIRTVKVVDRVAPVIIVHDPIIIQRTQPKPSLADSVDYSDNYYPKTALTLNIVETINVNQEGYYTVDYTVSDPSGNTSAVAKGLVIVVTATGIMPPVVNDAAINVYPNPAADKAYVSMNFIRETAAKVSVYSITGQRLFEASPEGSFMNKIVELNLENLQSGNYIIRVEGTDGVVNKKLIITK